MVIEIVALAVAAGAGFAAGRVKNSAKLAAVSAEIAKVEAAATADVKTVIAKIKSVL